MRALKHGLALVRENGVESWLHELQNYVQIIRLAKNCTNIPIGMCNDLVLNARQKIEVES